VSRDGSIELALSPRFVSASLGKDLTLVIRPEPVTMADSTDDQTITASVTVTELLGDAKVVHVDAAGNEFLAKVSPDHEIYSGETVHLRISPEEQHLFDGVDGRAKRVEPTDVPAPEA
jgi:ABC-type sugar transport system ATPase subunit